MTEVEGAVPRRYCRGADEAAQRQRHRDWVKRSKKKMVRIVAPISYGLVLLLTATAWAQNSAVEELFGNGVHAYFSGDYVAAHGQLTSAIDAGSNDPRAYYFRGFCYMKLGREPEAKVDFARGAKLETGDTDHFYDVSKGLERIQGRPRLLLERQRSEARLLAQQELDHRRYDRYQRIRRAESQVLLKAPPAAGPEAEKPADAFAPETPKAPGPADPFAPPAAPMTEKPAAAPPVKPADPFAPETPKAEKSGDPFAPPAPPMAEEKPAEGAPPPQSTGKTSTGQASTGQASTGATTVAIPARFQVPAAASLKVPTATPFRISAGNSPEISTTATSTAAKPATNKPTTAAGNPFDP